MSYLRIAAFLARLLPLSVKQVIYNNDSLAQVIRRSLNCAAPTGLIEVSIAAGGLKGAHMSLDLQTEKDYWLGTYETDLQAAVSDLVEPGWVAYDVGANIGYITLLLARAVGDEGRILAFEALPSNVERLKGNVTLNGLDSRVQVIHGAVGAASTPVRFLVGPSGAMGKAEGSAGRSEGHQESIEVLGFSLDDFVYQGGNPSPQVVKMDIEGGEVLALPGMKRLLAEAPPLIFLELHGPEAARAAWETLTEVGYRIARMQHGYPNVPSLDTLDWKTYLVAIP
ncbi:MAG: FkbM family methyltransferase [Anaerolineales bacterium]|nr:FkbM family methyltransferase [Anaerolineales bacterium]